METNYLKIKKQRDLGEIITDTFQFLKLNFKTLLKLILKITWPAMLFALLALGYYFWSFGAQTPLFDGIISPDSTAPPFSFFFGLFIILLAASVFYALLNGAVLGIMKSYANHDGQILETEVEYEVRTKFWKIWGANILAGLLTGIGFVLCLIPGIYLMVPLSLISAIIVFQDKGISDALSECFHLIKDNWWITFATIIVMVILYYLINFIVQIPLTIYVLVKAFAVIPDGASNPNEMVDGLFIALNLFFTMIQYILGAILIVTTGFIYYNLNEQKHSSGTLEDIEKLGRENN